MSPGYFFKINIFLLVVSLQLVMPCARAVSGNKEFEEQKISIKENVITVEIADTPAKREKGLMYREKLNPDSGMLFIFEIPHYYAFWMENTKIPLSLAFIGQDFKITEIVDLKPMDTTLAVPSRKILYVLEMNKGWFEKNKVKAGDVINGIKKKPDIK